MTDAEFAALLADDTKCVVGDIRWSEDEDHSPSLEFRMDVESVAGYPIFVRGSYNPLIHTLSYVLIHKQIGRVYALDMGKDHRNPSDHQLVGEKHKHRWTQAYRDKDAYVPADITAASHEPLTVWKQFCAEANLTHDGNMFAPMRGTSPQTTMDL